MSVQKSIAFVTEAITNRSAERRARYLAKIAKAFDEKPKRKSLGCANLAHGFAACEPHDKAQLRSGDGPNLGILTSFNDMLSAHQPFERYPDLIRAAAREVGLRPHRAVGDGQPR